MLWQVGRVRGARQVCLELAAMMMEVKSELTGDRVAGQAILMQ
jgi:hypothetical protein